MALPYIAPTAKVNLDYVSAAEWNALTAAVAEATGGGAVRWTSGTTRPTSDTGTLVIFTGADPGAAALTGDKWIP